MAESTEQRAQRFEGRALASNVAGATIQDKLRQAVTERFSSSPLAGQRAEAVGNVLTSGSRSRENIGGILRAGQAGEPGGAILSPTQQQAITSQRFASDIVPLIGLNALFNRETGGIGDIVGAGVGAFQAQNIARQGQATLARTAADRAAAQREADRQFSLDQLKAGGGGGGLAGLFGGGGSLADLFATGGERTGFQENVQNLAVTSQLIKDLAAAQGEDIPGFRTAVTGPLASSIGRLGIGTTAEQRQLGARVGTVSDAIRKQLFGTAFTAAEQKVGTLPGRGKQETENIDTLTALRNAAEESVRAQLAIAGITNPLEQDLAIAQASGTNPLESFFE